MAASDSKWSRGFSSNSSGSNTSDGDIGPCDHDQISDSPPSPISNLGECAKTQLPSKPKLKKSVSWAETEHNLCKIKSIAQIDLQLQASYRFNASGNNSRRGRGLREGDEDDDDEDLECGYHSDTESSTSDGYVGGTDSLFSPDSSWTTGSDEEEEERNVVFGETIQDAQGRYGSRTGGSGDVRRGFDEEMLPAKPMRGYFATRVVDVIEDEENINVEGECEEVWRMWMSE